MRQRIDRSMRVPARPLIGIVIWAAYAIYAVVSVLPSGIDFDELADTPSNVIKGIVIPLGPGAAALLAGVYFMGWWRPVFHEQRRSPRWTLLIAALLGLGVVVALVRTDWAGTEGSLLLWLAFGAPRGRWWNRSSSTGCGTSPAMSGTRVTVAPSCSFRARCPCSRWSSSPWRPSRARSSGPRVPRSRRPPRGFQFESPTQRTRSSTSGSSTPPRRRPRA